MRGAGIVATAIVSLLLAGASGLGCGGDRDERGLAPPDEQAAPFAAHETSSEEKQAKKKIEQAEESDQATDQAAGEEPETREPPAEQP